jgi:plastocyanin
MNYVKPNLIGENGTPPPVEQVHMHHAVFLNLSRRDVPSPGLPQRFYAFAEEKTTAALPAPYGYPVGPGDVWAINYMLHNETPQQRVVWITYDVDFVPKASPTGLLMKPAIPLWLDVQNGKAYPVFDVHRGAGHGGLFTYPDDQPNAYGDGPKLNEWTADRDLTLLAGAGHVHPGGLWTDLNVERGGRTALAYRSNANYFDPNGPVSWDMAMDFTPPDWRVAVHKGDVLRVSATYDSSRASWYESMGIMLMYAAEGASGPDPFAHPVDRPGAPTHGHLPEDGNHGGAASGLADPSKLPSGQTVQNGVAIADFTYMPGDLTLTGAFADPPVVAQGASLRFGNFDAPESILHTVTACRQPCTGSTGLSYPLADGPVQFDSGQLGYGPGGATAAAQRPDWYTPTNLPPGTYTYFCRVHPFMRGAFRVSGTAAGPAARGSARSAPWISILSKSLRMDRRGRVAVRVRCNGSARGTCRGTLQLATARGRRTVSLGSARLAVHGGRASKVRIKLSRAARSLVRRRHRLAVLARARPAGGGATAGATLILSPAAGRRR